LVTKLWEEVRRPLVAAALHPLFVKQPDKKDFF
jgi:hypothetical protein